MPQENKKRGRREEKKRKHAEYEEDQNTVVDEASKRQRSDEEPSIVLDTAQPYEPPFRDEATQHDEEAAPLNEVQFYGLLDEEEQAYFKRADTMLELNQFAEAEERSLFLANVYKEADGKELKLANSQSCSRLMERLIQLSTPNQLKTLFRKFNGHFLPLAQHRFASHCCEALFRKAAPVVTEELINLDVEKVEQDGEEPIVSMESCFLSVVEDFKPHLGYLMTDVFASHTLRVLLIVLSGRSLADLHTGSLLKSKKKEKIEITGLEVPKDDTTTERTVPDSFRAALEGIISGTSAGLETSNLRALATQPIANPVLQLLLELEFSLYGKQYAKDQTSLFWRIIPDDPPTDGTESASFIRGLLYDSVGSRLLETIVQHGPAKAFKAIYKSIFRENLKSIVKNEIAGFVMIKCLERLSKEDFQAALVELCPEIPSLVERGRIQFVTSLVNQCQRRNLEGKGVADGLSTAYGPPGAVFLEKVLGYRESSSLKDVAGERKAQVDSQQPAKLQGSLLAQAMLKQPRTLGKMIFDSFLAVDADTLIAIAKDRTATYALQTALAESGDQQAFRRRTVQTLLGHIAELATDPISSHVVDSLWSATSTTFFLREKIAEELLQAETEVRETPSGRALWRNWMLDIYKRRKVDWIAKAKTGSERVEKDSTRNQGDAGKSKIQLARERFGASKTSKGAAMQGRFRVKGYATGVNAGALKTGSRTA